MDDLVADCQLKSFKLKERAIVIFEKMAEDKRRKANE